MSETTVDLAALRRPFRPEQIGKLPRVTCPKCAQRGAQCSEHVKSKCGVCQAYVSERHIHLDYVGHADVTSRLLEVDPAWNWEPMARDERGLPVFDLDSEGQPVGLWIRLTVGGVTRLGYGSVPSGQPDAVKVLIGDCLLRGTPVQTARGTVRIEDVHVGDLVPTRDGWRRVTDHWLSHPLAPALAVLLADGRVIVGTPHHRVPTANRGLQRIEALRNGDMLYAWQATARTQAQTRSSGTDAATGVIPVIPTGIVASTSWRPPHRATTCTPASTRQRTGRSPKAGTSITATLTRLITTPETSSPSRRRITLSGTASTWSPTSGTAMNAASLTRRSADGAAGVLLLARNAGGAETGLPTFAPARDLPGMSEPARNAGLSSPPSDRGRVSAQVAVVAVLDAGPGEVWNLSVEGAHEYVANGIIVRNSLRNAAMRFGVAVDLWDKGDRADPAAENATASAGQAARRGRSAGDAFEDAAPARPQQRGRPRDGIDAAAQAFAEEAHKAATAEAIEDIRRRAREAGKVTALVRNPAGGTGKLGQLAVYLDWRGKQLSNAALSPEDEWALRIAEIPGGALAEAAQVYDDLADTLGGKAAERERFLGLEASLLARFPELRAEFPELRADEADEGKDAAA